MQSNRFTSVFTRQEVSVMRNFATLNRCRKAPNRRGVAAVEFAVCLPIIVLLVMGSIEASSFIFLKQSLSVAAYEGAREAIRTTSGSVEADGRARSILTARQVQGFQINFPGTDPSTARRGDEIIVQVTAPSAPNSPLAGQFVADRLLTSSVVMVKE